MEGVDTTVSTLRGPSTVTAVKDLYWKMMAVSVEVMLIDVVTLVRTIK